MGGRFFDKNGKAKVNFSGNAKAFVAASRLLMGELRIPFLDEASITKRFVDGRAAMVVNGPWMLSGWTRKGIPFAVAPMPRLDSGRRMGTYIGVRCVVLGSVLNADQKKQFYRLFNFMTADRISRDLSLVTKFTSPVRADHNEPGIRRDPVVKAFNRQIEAGFPMNNTPEMAKIWKAFNADNMKKLLTGSVEEVGRLLDRLQRAIYPD